MVREIEFYASEAAAKQAKLRSAPRHVARWRPIQTENVGTQWKITWSNDPDPPPIPPISMTQRAFTEMLAKERNVTLT